MLFATLFADARRKSSRICPRFNADKCTARTCEGKLKLLKSADWLKIPTHPGFEAPSGF